MKGGYFDTIEKQEVTPEQLAAAYQEFLPVLQFFNNIESGLFQLTFHDYKTLPQSTIDYWVVYKNYRSQDKP